MRRTRPADGPGSLAWTKSAIAKYRAYQHEMDPAPRRKFWDLVQAKADDADDGDVLWIYDTIGFDWWDGGVTAAGFAKELAQVTGKKLTVRINSPGGDVFDGIAIGNLLAEHSATKTIKVDALAASIASVIAVLAGSGTDDKIIMGRGAQLMIHDASGFAMGNAADMREIAELLDMISNNIADIYASRAGGTTADWRKTMKKEQWYLAQEAVDAGLADEATPAAADEETVPCPDCEDGKVDGKTCPTCDGSGEVAADDQDNERKAPEDRWHALRLAARWDHDLFGGAHFKDIEPLPPKPLPAPVVLDGLPAGISMIDAIRLGAAQPDDPGARRASWRDLFDGLAQNMPEPVVPPGAPVDLGPRPVAAPVPARNFFAELIAIGIDAAVTNRAEPDAPPVPPADLGPAPPRTPDPPPRRRMLADLIDGAVSLTAMNQPEPDPGPSTDPTPSDPPFRLDVADVRRATREARF